LVKTVTARLDNQLLQKIHAELPRAGEETVSALIQNAVAWSIKLQGEIFTDLEKTSQSALESRTKSNGSQATTCRLEPNENEFLVHMSASLSLNKTQLLSHIIELYLTTPEVQKAEFRAARLAQQTDGKKYLKVTEALWEAGYLQCEINRDR
jgi:hypothetical protein